MDADDLPRFPLFPDAFLAGVFERSPETCGCCERARGWIYTGPIYGEGDTETPLCPWCIADGSAADRLGFAFNDATQYPWLDTTPQLPPDEKRMVERLTPGFTTWQGNRWLACCGVACVFLGDAFADDLSGRWRDIATFIRQDADSPFASEDEIVQIARNRGIWAYAFQCRKCRRLLGYWDSD